jgi:hypothetical protein
MMLAGTAMLMLALPVMAGMVAALPQAMHQVRTAAAAADQAITRGLEAIGLPLGALPVLAPENLPQLKMARVAAPVAELPSFIVAAWQPQEAPAVAPPPSAVATSAAALKPAPVAQSANTPSPASLAVKAINPRGEGEPNAITCRVPQQLPGSRLRGPEVCQANRVWAALYANQQVMLPDGKTVVATGWQSEACGAARVAGVAAIAGMNGPARTLVRCSN